MENIDQNHFNNDVECEHQKDIVTSSSGAHKTPRKTMKESCGNNITPFSTKGNEYHHVVSLTVI